MSNPDINAMSEADAFAAALQDDAPEAAVPQQEAVAPAPAADGEPPATAAEGAGQPGVEGVDSAHGAPNPAPEDAIFASLPEEARAYVESLRNRERELESASQAAQRELAQARNDHAAMAGKLRPLQQRLADYEKAQREQPRPQQPAVPAQAETVDDLDAFLKSDEWQQYAATFPSEAAVWEKGQRASIAIAAKLARTEAERAAREVTDRFAPTIRNIESERAQRARQDAISDLAAEHPDWQQINEDPAFSEWFDSVYLPEQLDVVQQAFADDAYAKRKLSDPGFVKKLLHNFKAHRGITAQAPAASTPAPRATTPARLAVAAAPTLRADAPTTRLPIDRMTPEQAFQAALHSPDS